MSDTYHHGNLREALIEAGIRIINESGEDALSLRKVASACDVSHAAPYAHFKDKNELIEAIKKSRLFQVPFRTAEYKRSPEDRRKKYDDYPPFVLLKETYLKYLKESGIKKNKKDQEVELLKIWASAHGLAAIACMSGVIPSFDWDEMLEDDDLLK